MSNIFDLADLIGVVKIDGLGKVSNFFISTLIHNYKNETNNEVYSWSNILTKEELNNLKNSKKEILGKDENGKIVTVYRQGNKIYAIKKFNEGIRLKKII